MRTETKRGRPTRPISQRILDQLYRRVGFLPLAAVLQGATRRPEVREALQKLCESGEVDRYVEMVEGKSITLYALPSQREFMPDTCIRVERKG